MSADGDGNQRLAHRCTFQGSYLHSYLALGVGLLKSLDFFTRQHVPARFGALLAILFGLWMLKDCFLPDVGWRLQAPGRVGRSRGSRRRKPRSRR